MSQSSSKIAIFITFLSIFSVGSAQPDLTPLGNNTWTPFRPAWSLTVNDQCLYEFVFQFEHNESLPMGEQNFEGKCVFKDPVTKLPFVADDGKYFLDPRQYWERFPDYVWATMGFNHLSIDWLPCGTRPRGYSAPHYAFSFFRVTPEFRVQNMVCKTLTEGQIIIPGEPVCDFNQESIEGMGFFVVPGALVNRNPVVNMPFSFKRPELGNGPIPYYGLRSWDQDNIPETPTKWNDLPLFMSTYAGDLVMWQVHVPHKLASGDTDQFTSGAHRYFQTTVQTLPDTYAVDYDESDGVTRFIMIGRSQLCRDDFEKAQRAFGGPPVFPYYGDDDDADDDGNGNGNGNNGNGNGNGNNGNGNSSAGRTPFLFSFAALLGLSFLIRQ